MIQLSDDSDHDEVVVTKRPRLQPRSPPQEQRKRSKADLSEGSSSEAEPEQSESGVNQLTAKLGLDNNPAAAGLLAQLLEAILPRQPVAGPSRLPQGSGSSGSGKKGKKDAKRSR